jgi:hypothetical protein
MSRIHYACRLFELLDYSVSETVRRDSAGGDAVWQVAARRGDHAIVARASSRREAWREACRMADLLQCED